MIGCVGSGGEAKSLMRTNVSSATSPWNTNAFFLWLKRRLVSPARKISFMAWNCVRRRGPKSLFSTPFSLARKSSMSACAGTTLRVFLPFTESLPNALPQGPSGSLLPLKLGAETFWMDFRRETRCGQLHTGLPKDSLSRTVSQALSIRWRVDGIKAHVKASIDSILRKCNILHEISTGHSKLPSWELCR